MTYTPFGEYFKILRIKHHETLMDAKEFLNASCAFISSVECGKKPIPSNWFEKIVSHYDLNNQEQNELIDAIERSKTSVKINLESINGVRREVAIQFQRSFDDLDDDIAEKLLEILQKR